MCNLKNYINVFRTGNTMYAVGLIRLSRRIENHT